MTTPVHAGWYLAAFSAEIPEGLAPLQVGDRALMTVRTGPEVRVYDAICPHRGANLAFGGELVGATAVRCPFHGRRIALGGNRTGYRVAVHESFHADGMLFVRLSADPAQDNGFRSRIAALAAERRFVRVVEADLPVPADIVVENGFDPEHFDALHHMPGMSHFGLVHCSPGQIAVSGTMNNGAAAGFRATAYSPTLVIAELRFEQRTQVVVTGAVPTSSGCRARIGYAIRPEDMDLWPHWAVGTRLGFAQDLPIWNHMDATITPLFGAGDEVLAAFRQYCGRFPQLAADGAAA